MKKQTKTYLAYGSNMDTEQMAHRCPAAKLVGKGWLEGWELAFKGSGTGSYLTIEPKEGGRVPLVVWEIGAADEESLDRYEGFPRFYFKKTLAYLPEDAKRRKRGMAYIMDESRPYGIPSDFYVWRVIEAYRAFGFDPKLLMDALERSARLSRR